MPLRDHFRGWLWREMEWNSFRLAWATYIAEALNSSLPDGFRASPNVQTSIEIDVAAFGNVRDSSTPPVPPGAGAWEPSGGTVTLPFELTEQAAEVLIHGYRDGRYLAGAIELVSEGNKDRPEAREAFIAKCETYLQRGVGLVIVDAVTTRAANLHDGLTARVSPTAPVWGERPYATASRREERERTTHRPAGAARARFAAAAVAAGRAVRAGTSGGELRGHVPPPPITDRGSVTIAGGLEQFLRHVLVAP